MQTVINRLQASFPSLKFKPGEQFCWSPETGEIIYDQTATQATSIWSLLHETGHALLKHRDYQADFELVRLEMAAWQKAQDLAVSLSITIDEDHIQDCLDTYRDWLHKRSICPECSNKSLQQGDYIHYRCFNCHTTWRVTTNRFCRAYRRQTNPPKEVIFT